MVICEYLGTHLEKWTHCLWVSMINDLKGLRTEKHREIRNTRR